MKKPLRVVRINYDYDPLLLEELASEAIKPFNDVFGFEGVDPVVAKITFEPRLDEKGLYGWAADVIRRRFVISNPDRYVLLVMPHPMMNEAGEPNPGLAGENVALLSTAPEYMDIADEKRFLRYASRVAAHEFGHMFPFELDHHERPVRASMGNCLMYSGGVNDRIMLDKTSLGFCGQCDYSIRIRHRTLGLIGTFPPAGLNGRMYEKN